jgi:hypothetical protein
MTIQDRLEKAHDFLEQHGSELARALSAVAVGRLSEEAMLARLTRFQNGDGGWWGLSEFKARISNLSSTINALHWLGVLNGRGSAALDNTVAFLSSIQQPDGRWDEPEEILEYNPRPWMKPGDYANQLWVTAAICRYLAEFEREQDVRFDAAVSFLRRAWKGDRFPGHPHTHWMALSLFGGRLRASEKDCEIVEGCKQVLKDAILRQQVGPVEYSSIALAAWRTGPVVHDLFEMALQSVLEGQAEDGGWDVANGDLEDRVTATTRNLFLLRLKGGER